MCLNGTLSNFRVPRSLVSMPRSSTTPNNCKTTSRSWRCPSRWEELCEKALIDVGSGVADFGLASPIRLGTSRYPTSFEMSRTISSASRVSRASVASCTAFKIDAMRSSPAKAVDNARSCRCRFRKLLSVPHELLLPVGPIPAESASATLDAAATWPSPGPKR
eukprot:CAMPEP_0203898826 /NCGR_PEP_ID=MMETSP0359-20131031/41310_1 /ASSEMBLY_ACC=CAM_ASM_000338 /TAXON_ID=268821 /ORGANISM="Scrippsiella Hangoei, Strain SHTV-5" /LENGTH=162 /DNA_ID=CAMNT_0050821969 /DNA_START=284 /DNA_END=769 /DNA_ORIENTATION=+